MNESIYRVKKIKGPIDINASVPSSKNVLTRALVLAAMSDGMSVFKNVTLSQDTRTMMVALRDLGFSVFFSADMKEMQIRGMKGEIPRKNATLFVGNSATAARFLACMVAFSEGTYVLNASPLLVSRNMKSLVTSLRKLGAKVTCLGKEGHFPIKIEGKMPKEGKDLDFTLDISHSTQIVSSLLLVLPTLECKSKITVLGSNRDANIQLTLKLIEQFGQHISNVNNEYFIDGAGAYTAGTHVIEADTSSACYFLSLPLIMGGSASVADVNFDTVQGDINFINYLSDLGANIASFGGEATKVSCDKTVDGEYKVDMGNFSDEFSIMAVIAAIRNGKTIIENIGHLRHQECDRVNVMKENLEKCGIACKATDSTLTIDGGKPHGCLVDSHGDHRTAMAFTMLGLLTGDMAIADYEYVGKTFGEFFEEVERI